MTGSEEFFDNFREDMTESTNRYYVDFEEMMGEMESAVESIMDSTTKRQKRQSIASFNTINSGVKDMMDSFEELFEATRQFMSEEEIDMLQEKYDKEKVLFTQLNAYVQKELKDTKRSTRKLFGEFEDGVDDVSSSIGSMTDIINTLQLGSIADKLSGDSESTTEKMRNAATTRNMTYEEVKAIKDSLTDEDLYNGKIGAQDILDVYSQMPNVSEDLLEEIRDEVALFVKLNESYGLSAESISDIVYKYQREGWTSEDITDLLEEISAVRGIADPSTVVEGLDGIKEQLVSGKQEDYIKAVASYDNLGLSTDVLNEIISKGTFMDTEGGTLSSYTNGYTAQDLTNLLQEGEYDELAKIMVDAANNIKEASGGNEKLLETLSEYVGMSKEDIKALSAVTSEDIQSVFDEYDNVDKDLSTQSETIMVGKWDSLMNKLSTTWVGDAMDKISEFSYDNPVLTGVGATLGTNALTSIGKKLLTSGGFKGLGTGKLTELIGSSALGSKLTGALSTIGESAGALKAAGAAKLSGIGTALSGAGSSIASFLGMDVTTAATAGGATTAATVAAPVAAAVLGGKLGWEASENNWLGIGDAAYAFWDKTGLGDAVVTALDFIEYDVPDALESAGNAIKDGALNLREDVGNGVKSVSDYLENDFKDDVKDTFDSFYNNIKDRWDKAMDGLGDLGSKISEKLNLDNLLEDFNDAIDKIKEKTGKGSVVTSSAGLGKGVGSLVGKALDKVIDGSHENGLSNVPRDGYIAELHEGERVLTKNENKNYSDGRVVVNTADNKKTNSEIEKAIKVLEDGFTFLGKKIDSVEIKVNNISKVTRSSRTSSYLGGSYGS